MWYVYEMEYYQTQRNEYYVLHILMQMILKNHANEISHRGTYYMIAFIWGVQNR